MSAESIMGRRFSPEKSARIKQRIIDMHQAGSVPYDIAQRANISTRYVHLILRAEGFEPTSTQFIEREVHPMWSMEPDAKRRSIAKRAAQGARETINALPAPFEGEPDDGVDVTRLVGANTI